MRHLCFVVLSMLLPASALSAGMIQDVSWSADSLRPGQALTIGFRLSRPASVTVTIIDTDMHPVKAYALGRLEAAAHQVQWDGTDSLGAQVPSEAYTWQIRALAGQETDTWEPAGLRSRPFENILGARWDAERKRISYSTSIPMRVWVRIGVSLGACVRVLVEGEPRSAGSNTELWDGLDETNQIGLLDRDDWRFSVFGYRLPQPCVIVNGSSSRQESWHAEPAAIAPSPTQVEAPWMRRRAFVLGDRLRPELRVEQLGADTFCASLTIPAGLRAGATDILQRALGAPIRLKWFIDGRCAAEEVDAALPSLLTLLPSQVPRDGKKHFLTANVVTALHQIHVGSIWIE